MKIPRTLPLLALLLASQLFLPSGAGQDSGFRIQDSGDWPQPPAFTSPSQELLIAGLRAAPARPRAHKFFDRHNLALIAAGAGLRAADVYTTHRFLQLGGRERLMPDRLVRNPAAFSLFSAGAAAATAGGMYIAHRKRWHCLERGLGWAQAAFLGYLVVNNARLIHDLSRPVYPQIPQSR